MLPFLDLMLVILFEGEAGKDRHRERCFWCYYHICKHAVITQYFEQLVLMNDIYYYGVLCQLATSIQYWFQVTTIHSRELHHGCREIILTCHALEDHLWDQTNDE